MKLLKFKPTRRKFAVARDALGVPHITAAAWRDALYGLGFMHATDRPTQMLFARAVASGRAAELIAGTPDLLDSDRFFRRVGLSLRLDDEVRQLDDLAFGHLTAYCEGVNDGMHQGGRSLPMWATGFQPLPWNQQSVMLIGNLLNFGGLAVGQQQNERLILELIQAGIDDAKLRELFAPLLDQADFELLRRIKMSNNLSDEVLELISDLPRLAGSNAWAVAPSRSASGAALLAADPHLEVNRLPAIWYEAVLNWDDDQYVMGATLPGCPMFGIGRNRELSWGVTYLKGDTSDYFIEDCRPTDDGWQYRREDDWRDFSVRTETLRRKGGAPEQLDVLYNDVGTLEAVPQTKEAGLYLSVSWTGDYGGVGKSVATWLALIDCDRAETAMDIVRESPQPTLCWVFADREGHIGKQANGWFPIRKKGEAGLLPVPAWDLANHWQGWQPSHQLPRELDPWTGYVATANENINPSNGPQLVTTPVPDYRKRRIVERLDALPAATLKDMQTLQYDVVSMQARDVLAVFLSHLPDGPLRDRLAAWDCNYEPGSVEATLFSRLYRHVLLEIFGHDQGIGWRRMLYLCSRVGFSLMIVTSIDRLLQKEDSLWWRGRDKGDLIRRAAEKIQNEPDQPWAVTNAFSFTNRFFESQFVGRTLGFHTGELPMRGCHATPFQGHLLRVAKRQATFAPSYHFTTDMHADEAWTNLPGGPSESRFSGFYRNDIALWLEGRYKRLAPRAHTTEIKLPPLAIEPEESEGTG